MTIEIHNVATVAGWIGFIATIIMLIELTRLLKQARQSLKEIQVVINEYGTLAIQVEKTLVELNAVLTDAQGIVADYRQVKENASTLGSKVTEGVMQTVGQIFQSKTDK